MRSFAVLLVAGCGSSGFEIRDPSCDVDVTRFTRDVTFHVLQGDGSGAFDYPTGLGVIGSVAGSYDPVSGDFSWSEAGAEGSTLASASVTGYGYAQENGDLDVIGTRVTTDILEVEQETQFRVERTGCTTRNQIRSFTNGIPQETVEDGEFTEAAYTYVQVTVIDGADYVTEGERDDQGGFAESIRYKSDSYELEASRTGNLWQGESSREYAETYQTQGGTAERNGTEDRRRDGSRSVRFTQQTRQGNTEWAYDLDYEGNGGGTVSGQGFECRLTFTSNRCTYDCGGGQRGNC